MLNLYWPVYENIENEIVDMTRTIHFCDEQLDTFSTRISDLLLRISVEIESISKEIFNSQFSVGDKLMVGIKSNIECELCEDGEWRKKNKKGALVQQNLYFDHNCIKYLDEKWNLSERKVTINSPNMFFLKNENVILFPLSIDELTKPCSSKDRGGWLKSYQAIKHSRIKNQSQGSVYYMIHALAALYILNIYYRYFKKESQIVNIPFENRDFDFTCGSKIFSTTEGETRNDIFVSQFNGFLELNVNQKIRYVKFDSHGFPIYDGIESVTYFDGSLGEEDKLFEKEQQ